VHRFLRNLTIYASALAVLLIAPRSMRAAPPEQTHRAVVTRVAPVYPELAKRMHVGGSVVIRVVVLPNGTVSEIHTESGHPLLRSAAEDAVRHWHFAPDPNSSESADCIVSVDFDPH
jgi:TonB family protein